MMHASQLAVDAMYYVAQLTPFFLVFGGVAFADVIITYLIRLVRTARDSVRW